MAFNGVIVDVETGLAETNALTDQPEPRSKLVAWVLGNVDSWRQVRDSTYRDKWNEYYKIWRGRWSTDQKNRRTERSRLISPATQVAVDLTVSEIVEAVFGRETFIDIADDIADTEKQDAQQVRDALIEDLKKDGILEEIVEIALNGALYGNFNAKIVTEVCKHATPQIFTINDPETGEPRREVRKVVQEIVKVYPVAVEPGQLVVDPAATRIDDMLGAAHEFRMPLHKIRARQGEGTYYDDVKVGGSTASLATDDRAEDGELGKTEGPAADICEYHGFVPAKMLTAVRARKDDALAQAMISGTDDAEMVEAVVTIANGGILLRAIPNPSVMEDRALVAAQFDTVPNRFWGRGIVEKGYNVQRALDAELRSRADSLAWINNPMVAGDITKLPPKTDLNVWPGKFWPTKGDPGAAIREFRFGDVNASTFQQAADLERMLQQATGAVDPASIGQNVRDQSFGASAVAVSGIVKRTKRIMLNFESFLTTLVRRIVWRKMQYEPDRYPADFEFVVRGSIGLMAREIEQQFLTQLLQTVDRGSPQYLGLLKLVVENSSSPHRAELVRGIDAMLQPPNPEQAQAQAQQKQQIEQIQLQTAQAQLALLQAQAMKAQAEAGYKHAQKEQTEVDTDLRDEEQTLDTLRIRNDMEETSNQVRQLDIQEQNVKLNAARLAMEARRGNV